MYRRRVSFFFRAFVFGMGALFLFMAVVFIIQVFAAFSFQMLLVSLGPAFFAFLFFEVATSRFEIHWNPTLGSVILLAGAYGLRPRREIYPASDIKSLVVRQHRTVTGSSFTLFFKTNSGTENFVSRLLASEAEALPPLITEAMKGATEPG